MAARRDRVRFQRQMKRYHEHCCVPQCSASSKYNGLLSFHGFPRDPALRRRWLQNIRREEMKLTQHSKVCSLHFRPDQLLRPRAAGGRRVVSRGAVPVLFPWSLRGTGLSEPDRRPNPPGGPNLPDHDYCSVPEPADRDLAVHGNQKLTEETDKQADEPETPSRFGLQRFTGSDDDIRFYTRFASYRLFLMFWRLIEPTVHHIRSAGSRSSEAAAAAGTTHTRDSLQPIDELLLFQMYLAAGLKEGDLANRFQIHPSTASRIICSWADYLYFLLGSLCVWMDADDIRAQLPEDFRDFADTQLIVGSSELRCQTAASAVLQTEPQSHCVMRGLTGTAPHGVVTFVSSLYEGSVSDAELFVRSGLADRLPEDRAVMVGGGFLISGGVKCKVYCPPFLSTKPQAASQNARLLVHVERVTHRVTENKLFDSVIPFSMAGNINKLFTVACLLVNYQNNALNEERPSGSGRAERFPPGSLPTSAQEKHGQPAGRRPNHPS